MSGARVSFPGGDPVALLKEEDLSRVLNQTAVAGRILTGMTKSLKRPNPDT